LGLSGISVALAISKVAPSRRGHNVFISDLGGGLGIFAAQLYKLEGARVVGSVTSLSMLNYARLLGFTDVFIVNRETDIEIGIVRFFPRGIDVFFDCVGGSAYQRALDHVISYYFLFIL
jgi:NADPH-dependent curcumin reductase CurA